jgi:hypothetical protein
MLVEEPLPSRDAKHTLGANQALSLVGYEPNHDERRNKQYSKKIAQ